MTWHSGCGAEGKTILVTGASAGIGYFAAEQIAAAGATVALGCRDTAKAGPYPGDPGRSIRRPQRQKTRSAM